MSSIKKNLGGLDDEGGNGYGDGKTNGETEE